MGTAKQEVESLLNKLPDDCSLEDIQYHLYVIEKVRHGLDVADTQGEVSQDQVEQQGNCQLHIPRLFLLCQRRCPEDNQFNKMPHILHPDEKTLGAGLFDKREASGVE